MGRNRDSDAGANCIDLNLNLYITRLVIFVEGVRMEMVSIGGAPKSRFRNVFAYVFWQGGVLFVLSMFYVAYPALAQPEGPRPEVEAQKKVEAEKARMEQAKQEADRARLTTEKMRYQKEHMADSAQHPSQPLPSNKGGSEGGGKVRAIEPGRKPSSR